MRDRDTLTIGVTAVGSGVGQVILDALRVSPLNVRVIGFEATGWSKGLYECNVGYRLPLASEPSYGEVLQRICLKERVDLLIPGSDPELPMLAEMAPSLEAQGCRVLVGSALSVRLCQDKKAFHDRFAQLGLPLVPTMLLSEALRDPQALPYPLILKPRCGAGSVGVRVIGDPSDWQGFVPREIASGDEDWVVQPLLRSVTWDDALWERMKRSWQPVQKDQIALQCLLSRDGEVLGHLVSQVELKSGVVKRVELCEDGTIWKTAEPLVTAFAALGARGPLNLQGFMTSDGIRFFEANPRFTGSSQVRTLLGYREVEAAVRHFALQEPPSKVRACLKPVSGWVCLRQMTERVVLKVWVERFETEKVLRAALPMGRAVVTGASGYLGPTLVRTLLEREVVAEVIAPVRDPKRAKAGWDGKAGAVHFEPWDGVGEPPCLDGADLVVHAAAIRPQLAQASDSLFQDNLALTHAVLRGVWKHQNPLFVFISSQSVYEGSQPPPWREETPLAPVSPYGYAKAAGEAATRMLEGSPTRWGILRMARLYGWALNLQWNEVANQFSRLAREGLPLPVHGDGQQTLDLLHIRDAAAVIATLAGSPFEVWNAVYNVGSGSPISVLELAKLCQDLAKTQYGTRPLVEVVPQAKQPLSWGLSIRRAQETLGWCPKISLAEGLSELMAHVPETHAGGDSAISSNNTLPQETGK